MTSDLVTLFTGGRGYRAVRIPAIAALDPDHLVVVAVGRRRVSDWGPSDLLLRRSADGGETWSAAERLVRGWCRTVDNPTLVVDRSGVLHLLYQVGYRRLLHRRSADGGRTFSAPVDLTTMLTSIPERDGFVPRRFAPGPGSGALLAAGRLVVPVWASSARGRRHRPSATFTITSDDDGMTWAAGEYAAFPGGAVRNPSEAAIAALPDGGALLTVRQKGDPRRVFTRSTDGATGWSTPHFAPEIFEPVCHAALVAGDGRVFFVNPDSRDSRRPRLPDGKAVRENLTLRVSRDDGATWGEARVLDPGPAGYSALAEAGDGT
ncbi:sialidase family protein, partial [Pseudolysinimonas sp.]|uniref:sialidase family protein n=1 Tax=Pseudolysinimonas sp. TaxID=2680009 RepID=UPI00286CAD60